MKSISSYRREFNTQYDFIKLIEYESTEMYWTSI